MIGYWIDKVFKKNCTNIIFLNVKLFTYSDRNFNKYSTLYNLKK